MDADFSVEWTRDLGDGRFLVMDTVGCRASLAGFRGVGSTQEAALDDLLSCMRRYCEEVDAFQRSLVPGGLLHEKLRQLSALVDQVVQEQQS